MILSDTSSDVMRIIISWRVIDKVWAIGTLDSQASHVYTCYFSLQIHNNCSVDIVLTKPPLVPIYMHCYTMRPGKLLLISFISLLSLALFQTLKHLPPRQLVQIYLVHTRSTLTPSLDDCLIQPTVILKYFGISFHYF